mmetsp:Transcript_23830/g.68177  ORF Transcript_23830/g.68177 Transcript_23830/m.68177 type:complete len:238 (+) Transcript_23830:305-1018(+)
MTAAGEGERCSAVETKPAIAGTMGLATGGALPRIPMLGSALGSPSSSRQPRSSQEKRDDASTEVLWLRLWLLHRLLLPTLLFRELTPELGRGLCLSAIPLARPQRPRMRGVERLPAMGNWALPSGALGMMPSSKLSSLLMSKSPSTGSAHPSQFSSSVRPCRVPPLPPGHRLASPVPAWLAPAAASSKGLQVPDLLSSCAPCGISGRSATGHVRMVLVPLLGLSSPVKALPSKGTHC